MHWPLRYCPDCGAEAVAPPTGNVQTCAACGEIHYLNAKPCAGTLIERDGRVLLAKRAQEPRADTWDVVGGFLEPHELPAEAAVREAHEETGLDIELGDVFAILVDTYGDPNLYTLNVYYRALAPTGEPVPTSDVTQLQWFGPGEIPDDLSFPHEYELLRRWAETQ
jgi:ADP-ribose pyrophosphatase YjhB (NUDIX family)